jgi:hypothetical protein
MNAMYTGPLAGVGLTLPPESMHNAVLMLLLLLAVSYGFLFWAIRRAAHERGRS